MRHVGADRRRYGHPYIWDGYWVVLSELAVAVPALDWGTHAHPEYRVAGGLPAFIFIVGANRAYGLAGCLLVLSFGKIWRVLESPMKSRILSAGFICLLFAQCVYSDVIFLGAMLAAGALVGIRQQRWKILWAMAGIGLVAAASLYPRGYRGAPLPAEPVG